MHFKNTPTRAEQAIQRKLRDGKRLNGDDREVVQTRLRAMQKRGDYIGVMGGVPSGAENLVAAPNVDPAMAGINSLAQGMFSNRSPPDFSSHQGEMETKIRQINAQGSTSSFSFYEEDHNTGAPQKWTVSGSFALGPLALMGPGGTAGTGGGATGATGGQGSTSTNTTGSGGSVSGTATGPLGTSGASGSATGTAGTSSGLTTTGGQSSGGNSGQSSGGENMRETYRGTISCSYHVTYEAETTANPLSWFASALWDSKTVNGWVGDCGWLQFTLPAT